MARQNAEERVLERTRRAEEHLQDAGGLRAMVARAGLKAANVMDHAQAFTENDRGIFAWFNTVGAVQGACVAVLAVGALGLAGVIAGPLTPLIAVGIVAAGALGGAVYKGQNGLTDHLNSPDKTFGDQVARAAGALPKEPQVAITQGPDETMRLSGRDPGLETEVAATLLEGQGRPGYAAQVRASRGRTSGRAR